MCSERPRVRVTARWWPGEMGLTLKIPHRDAKGLLMKEGCCRRVVLSGFIMLAILAMVSCHSAGRRAIAPHIGVTPHVEVSRVHSWQLAARSRIYIAYPEAIASGQRDLPRTRADLQRLLRVHSAPRFQSVVSGDVEQSLEQAFAAARAAGCDVLFRPIVTAAQFSQKENAPDHLFDGSTDTGSRPDYLELRLSLQVYEAHSSRLLDTVTITAKRPWPATERSQNTLAQAAIETLVSSLAR